MAAKGQFLNVGCKVRGGHVSKLVQLDHRSSCMHHSCTDRLDVDFRPRSRQAHRSLWGLCGLIDEKMHQTPMEDAGFDPAHSPIWCDNFTIDPVRTYWGSSIIASYLHEKHHVINCKKTLKTVSYRRRNLDRGLIAICDLWKSLQFVELRYTLQLWRSPRVALHLIVAVC